jgi:hypothetical protein
MSQETQETNDGTFSGLKKTIIATLTTLITGGGAYIGTTIFGGHSEPKEEKVVQVDSAGHPVTAAPAPAPVIINVQQNQENTQQQKTTAPTVIRERVIEKQVPVKEEKKKEETKEEAPW